MADTPSFDAPTSDSPTFESPITRLPDGASGSLLLADESSLTKLLVRSDRPQFDVVFGSTRRVADTLVCGLRPGEWHVLGSARAVAVVEALIDGGGFTHVIDVTHGRALLRVTGADAASTLEKVCSLDWRDSMTPDGAATSAAVAKVVCDIVRDDIDAAPSYLIGCDRSFGQYLFDALLDAGDEFAMVAG